MGSNTQDNHTVQIDSSLEELIPGFMQNRMKELPVIQKLYEDQDFEGFEKFGHKLKGSSLNYGFLKLGELAHALEEAGKAKDLGQIKRLSDQIEEHVRNIKVVFTS